MNVTKRIKLDFGRASSPVVVWAKQGDEDSRFVEVVPLKNGNDYTIPSGVSIHFACKKPDGHQILNDYPTIKNNIITIPLTPQTLAAAGEGLASVILMDSATETILSTQNFILYIENNPLVGAEVESSDEYQSYLGALSKIEAFPYITPEAEGKVLGVKNGGYVFVDGGSGSGGSDGFSPSAKVEQTANGATITITDQSGTTVADIANGKDGESITIESVLGTDADGGENTVRFSDGTELIVYNGRKGTDGRNGSNGYSPEVTLEERDEGVYIEVQTQSGGSGATVYNGEDGKSAYEYAKDSGYTGTETDFAKKLAEEMPKTPTIIRETNYLVMEEEGTVLSTKMTRAQIIEATKGGMELHVLSDDTLDWFVYTMVDSYVYGDYVVFSIQDHDRLSTIMINITEDGRMIVSSIAVEYLSDKYSESNPPPYPVTSVNGKTGAVTLTNETWTFTLSDGSTVTKKVVLA